MKKTDTNGPRLVQVKKLIKCQAFSFNFHIVITNNIQESVRSFSKALGEKSSTFSGFPLALCYHPEGVNYVYIFLPFSSNVSNIVHEAYHAIVRLMKWVGADGDEEVVAYHLDWLTKEIYEFVNKTGNKPLLKEGLILESEYKAIINKFAKRAKDLTKTG